MKPLVVQPSAASRRLGPNILLSILISNTLICVLPLVRETKFHTHTKQQTKLVSNLIISVQYILRKLQAKKTLCWYSFKGSSIMSKEQNNLHRPHLLCLTVPFRSCRARVLQREVKCVLR